MPWQLGGFGVLDMHALKRDTAWLKRDTGTGNNKIEEVDMSIMILN